MIGPWAKRKEADKYVYEAGPRGEGSGDVFSDRVYRQWPIIFGGEVEEGPERTASRWPGESLGDVFSDRLYGEWPLLWGYEVKEE